MEKIRNVTSLECLGQQVLNSGYHCKRPLSIKWIFIVKVVRMFLGALTIVKAQQHTHTKVYAQMSSTKAGGI